MTSIKQLTEWVKGNSVHIGDGENGQCCPDFSCCNPLIDTPKEERELFAELYINEKTEEQEKMLMMFLGRSLATIGKDKDVYIAGGKKES